MINKPAQSIFDTISGLATSAGSYASVESAVAWLASEDLTRELRSLRLDSSRDLSMLGGMSGQALLGLPTHRVQRTSKAEIERLRNQRKLEPAGSQASPSTLDRIWRELKNPAGAVSILAIDRMPADALPFYRPFHWSPHEEWGIYMLAGRLLNYCSKLYSAFAGHLAAFTLETLLGCVLLCWQ